MAYKRRLKFDKRIRFKKQMNIIYILLFIVLASLGVGYAYIKSDLNINGTANVTAARWDVHFTNLNVTTGSVTASSPASITDSTTVTFATTLDEPKDFYEFTVDVTNTGTMDAMIDSFSISPTLTATQKKYLDYSIVYADGVELENKQELKAGTAETLIVRFKYKENSDSTNYPTIDQNFNISLTINYAQTDNTSEIVRNYLYRSNNYYFQNGDSILTTNFYCIYDTIYGEEGLCFTRETNCERRAQSSIDYECRSKSANISNEFYNSPANAMSSSESEVFLRHSVKDNLISNSSIGFVYNGNIYYLIGGGATYNSNLEVYNEDSIFYEQNKEILKSVFDEEENCEEYYDSVYGFYGYYCSDVVNKKRANVESNGSVLFVDGPLDGGFECKINDDTSSYCDVIYLS